MLKPLLARPFIAFLGMLFCLPPAFAALPERHEIVLTSKSWLVRIHPSTLEIRATIIGRGEIQLSAAQENLGRVSETKSSAEVASWELSNKGISVSCGLAGDAFSIQFHSRVLGSFTWPIIEGQKEIQGYILPLGEGFYISTVGSAWQDYLVEMGPLNTMEQLSMPFWGLDCGTYTLTYLMSNPFQNELTFIKQKSLASRLRHDFLRNQIQKGFGFQILLGGESPVEPARQFRKWLIKSEKFVSLADKMKKVPEVERLLGAAHVYLWGDGISSHMLQQFKTAGLDRLWLGLDGLEVIRKNPETVTDAKQMGYLIAPYDSYHSIHDPEQQDTWATAQFDRELFQKGAVIGVDGKKKPGFQGKGYSLSSIAARPYVVKRVSEIQQLLHFNSWFMDCDAAGELFDNFSDLYPATQEDDMKARLERMNWIAEIYQAVIGSEMGDSYAAPVIHFGQGMMTPVFGFFDPMLKDPQSKYFVGRYYPPDGPACFMKATLLPEKYRHLFFDPRSRLPLYQTALHDSVVTTHHWLNSSLKYSNVMAVNELLELLYNVPPLYHMNSREFARHQRSMKAHSDFFSPLHHEIGMAPMTDFCWLLPNRMIQRTVFGGKLEMVANFGKADFKYQGHLIPGLSILARWRESGRATLYSSPLAIKM